jgi:hypothetical protein
LSHQPRLSLFSETWALRSCLAKLIAEGTKMKGSNRQVNPVRLFITTTSERLKPTIASARVKADFIAPQLSANQQLCLERKKEEIVDRWSCDIVDHCKQGVACWVNAKEHHYPIKEKFLTFWASSTVLSFFNFGL